MCQPSRVRLGRPFLDGRAASEGGAVGRPVEVKQCFAQFDGAGAGGVKKLDTASSWVGPQGDAVPLVVQR